MIYNLVEYLKTELTALNFVANGFAPDSPVEATNISQTGGNEAHNHDRGDWAVQILSRASSSVQAKVNIDLVYAKMKNRFNLELPSVTVDNVVYAAVQTYQISLSDFHLRCLFHYL